MTKLESRRLCIHYGAKQALHGIDIAIATNEVLALIGPSGCGKSTFLRSLNRMNERIPGTWHEGQVLLDGKDIYGRDVDPTDVRRRVGMVFQRPNPFPTSIAKNVAYGLEIAGGKSRGDIVAIGSSADAGSSMSRTSGSVAIARAMQRRCCWPPERASALLWSWSLTSPQRAAARRLFSTIAAISPRDLLPWISSP